MKFEIEVNENSRQITMKGQDLDSSFSNSVYYSLSGLEKTMQEKVSPWIANCVKKAKENKDKLINELLDEGKSVKEIIYDAKTNDDHINSIILQRETKRISQKMMEENPNLTPLAAHYRAQIEALKQISM